MSTSGRPLTTNTLARIGLLLSAVLGLALLLLASDRGSRTLAQAASTPTPTAEPTSIPSCPGDRVDRNHNGQDNGDCIPLRDAGLSHIPFDYCDDVAGAKAAFGRVLCQPRWTIAGATNPLPIAPLQVNQGCVRIIRNPYPRLLVGLGNPSISFSGLIPAEPGGTNPAGWMTGYATGWYQSELSGPGAIGLPAGGYYAAGNWMSQPFGSTYYGSAFPPVRFDDPTADFYPSVNNIAMRLVFVLDQDVGHLLQASFAGAPVGMDAVRWDGVTPLRLTVNRSSNPSAAVGTDAIASSGGPDLSGPADLPAYRLTIRSSWTLYVQVYYEHWAINAGVYGRDMTREAENYSTVVNGWQHVESYRVWDAQQTTNAGLIGNPNCNALASAGYVPIPVMEGRSVLVNR